MPVSSPGPTPHAFAAPAGAHLTYYGGQVISNVKVYQVVYGAGTYLPETTSSGSPSVKSFFSGITNSAYFDWLTEYTPTSLRPAASQGPTR